VATLTFLVRRVGVARAKAVKEAAAEVGAGHTTNPRGFMDYKLNPRVDLGFVFMSMKAFCTHVILIFYEYIIGKVGVRDEESIGFESCALCFFLYI
jgi:hypothetical protein